MNGSAPKGARARVFLGDKEVGLVEGLTVAPRRPRTNIQTHVQQGDGVPELDGARECPTIAGRDVFERPMRAAVGEALELVQQAIGISVLAQDFPG